MRNRSLKENIFSLSEGWLSAQSPVSYICKFQFRGFLDIVNTATDDNDLIFKILNYLQPYMESDWYTVKDTKRFMARLFDHMYRFLHPEIPAQDVEVLAGNFLNMQLRFKLLESHQILIEKTLQPIDLIMTNSFLVFQ